MTRLRILHLDDAEADSVLVEAALTKEAFSFDLEWVDSPQAFGEALLHPPDIILADFSLPGFGGMEALAMARRLCPEVPLVFVSGAIGEEMAIDCLRAGATDYVLKHRLSRLGPVVRRALEEATERRQRRTAEEALRTAARTQRALLEAASVARVVPWSVEKDRLLLGHSAHEVLGFPLNALPEDPKALEALVHPEDLPLLQRALRTTDQHQVQTFECRMMRTDGNRIWTRWTVSKLPLRGAFQDICEQRRLQEELLRVQKLEALGTLSAGLSHDFNNLLQVIQAHADLLRASPDLPPSALRGLDAISGAVERGRSTIQHLRSFTHRVPMKRAPVNLNALVVQCRAMLEKTFPPGIRWNLNLEPNLPDTDLDSDQLHQVLVNLLINARDAMEGTGTLRLSTGLSAIGEWEAERTGHPMGGYTWVEVGDSGSGIPPERLDHIFEPFYTTKGEKGTGLGLAMTQAIVESHGGWIQVFSDPGRGTRFRLHLPLLRAEGFPTWIPYQDRTPSTPGV